MATTYRDYYAVLGVPRGASDETIRTVYRKLAREHHPDLHPESEKTLHTRRMQEINEAYAVLSDPEKRAKYDRHGSEWEAAASYRAQESGAPSEFESSEPMEGFSDFFRQFFGEEGGPFEPTFERARDGRDIEAHAEISLDDAVHGAQRSFRLGEKEISIRIPAGVQEGTLLRVPGQGRRGFRGQPAGDLYLRLELIPDPNFTVKGADLESQLMLPPWTAALGGEAVAKTLEGPLRVRIPKNSHTGRKLRVAGRGLRKDRQQRGDLFLRLEIDNPPALTPRSETLYRQLAEETKYQEGSS